MARPSPPEPLVVLHGFAAGPGAWDEVVTHLDAQATVLALTLWGHAGAAVDQAPAGFAQEVDRLADVVRARGIARAHLAGYSLGARLGLGLLLRHPELWRSATLIGLHPGLPSEVARAERRSSDRRWQQLLRRRGVAAFVAAWEQQPLFATQRQLPPRVLETQRALRLSHDREGLARSLELTGLGAMPDYTPELGRLQLPVTLLTGQRDAKFCELASTVVLQLPRGRWVSLPGAGHNLLLEAPLAVAAYLTEQLHSN